MKDFSREILERYSIRGDLERDRFELPESWEALENRCAEWRDISFNIYKLFLKAMERKCNTIERYKLILKEECATADSPLKEEIEKLMVSIEKYEELSRAYCKELREKVANLFGESDPENIKMINEDIKNIVGNLKKYYREVMGSFNTASSLLEEKRKAKNKT